MPSSLFVRPSARPAASPSAANEVPPTTLPTAPPAAPSSPMQRMRATMPHVRMAGVAAFSLLGAFLFGLDAGYLGTMVFWATFKRDVAHLADPNAQELSVLVMTELTTSFGFGAFLAALPCVSGPLMDKRGRRFSIQTGAALGLAGAVVQATSCGLSQMLAGRFASGAATGLLSTVLPLYIGEVAPVRARGTYLVMYQLMLTAGIPAAAIVNEAVKHLQNGWRYSIAVQAVVASVLLVGMFFMPRSPRWLVLQGRREEALRSLRSVRDAEHAAAELKEIEAGCATAAALEVPRWRELFVGYVGKLTALGAGLQFLQQATLLGAQWGLALGFVQSMGMSRDRLLTVFAVLGLAMTFPSMYLIERVGRRALLVWGSAFMLVSSVALGALGTLGADHTSTYVWTVKSQAAGRAMLLCVFTFLSSFALTWGPVVWAYCGEIYPLKHRSRCTGISTATNWGMNFALAQLLTVAYTGLGFHIMWVQAAFLVLGLAAVWHLPETRGLSLEDIDARLRARFGASPDAPGRGGKAAACADPAASTDSTPSVGTSQKGAGSP
uniref:Hexose transporter 1 n=1 Tax=Zooxanthella nutricula TaxID=1333877 RepID=A0A7S2HSG1_9DINO